MDCLPEGSLTQIHSKRNFLSLPFSLVDDAHILAGTLNDQATNATGKIIFAKFTNTDQPQATTDTLNEVDNLRFISTA
jgi:hypothetical protein